MNNELIDNISNNIVFKRIEEEADLDFKTIYNKNPLELMIFNKDKNNDLSHIFSISLNSLTESITIHYCLNKICSIINYTKMLQSFPTLNNLSITPRSGSCFQPIYTSSNNKIGEKEIEYIKNYLKKNLKYVTYLFYHMNSIDILNIHKIISSNSELTISYKNLFNYMILCKTLLKNNEEKQYIEFLLFLISKIDDLKISFEKKWENIIRALMYVFDLYNSDCQYAIYLNKILLNYCYELIKLNKNKYDLYKFIFSNELLFKSDDKFKNKNDKEFKYKKFIDSLNISTSTIQKSNLKYAKEFLKEHQQNIKNLKKFIYDFDNKEEKLKILYNNKLALIFFKEHYDDLKESIDKYSKEIEKIKI